MSTFDERALARGLRALADAEARAETPSHVEAAVMARWDAAHASPVRRPTRSFVRGAATVAAGVTIVGAVALQRQFAGRDVVLPPRPVVSFRAPDAASTPAPIAEATAAPAARRAEEARSTLVLVGEPIATGEILHLVRMRVARRALTALGVAETSAADVIDVDVLVGEDGVARGVRVPL